ncbi:MAG TPA: hypothetical protein VN963_07195 [bacterium]|nr:hypothetical protein [bacterium]
MKANQFKNLFQRNGTGVLACGVLALAGVFLASCNPTVNPASFPKINGETVVNAGDIAFTGIAYNGNSQFSFVPTTNIAAGVSIFFTNYTYDPTNASSSIAPFVDESTTTTSSSNYPGIGPVNWEGVTVGGNGVTISEGTIAYVVGSAGLGALSQVIISNTSNASDVLFGGSIYPVAPVASGSATFLTMNHNGAGQKILAYAVNGPVTTFVAGVIFGPDPWLTSGPVAQGAFWDSVLPSNLTAGTNAIDLSTLWNTGSQDSPLGQYNVNGNNDQNQNAVLNNCESTLAGIVNAANWQADGNEAKTKVILNGTGLTACTGAGYTGLIP